MQMLEINIYIFLILMQIVTSSRNSQYTYIYIYTHNIKQWLIYILMNHWADFKTCEPMANEIANVANLHLRILMNSELNSNKPEPAGLPLIIKLISSNFPAPILTTWHEVSDPDAMLSVYQCQLIFLQTLNWPRDIFGVGYWRYGKSPFFMGKSTISLAHSRLAKLNHQRCLSYK